MFIKYQHVEKFGNAETEGIELGKCFVFPKVDGTNASVWLEHGEIKGGSRTRELSLEKDNAGFLRWVLDQPTIKHLLTVHPDWRLFGEFLVPHTVKDYREDAWRQLYIFDVMVGETYLPYEAYQPILEHFEVEYIPPQAIISNPSEENLIRELDKNNYLMQDGKGAGEGIVVKNYDYRNKYGRQTWAKIVRSEFKEKFHKKMGPPEMKGERIVEEEIAIEFCTDAFIQKEFAKLQDGDWTSKRIPELLGRVWHEFIVEETFAFIKAKKNPTVDFGKLQKYVNMRIRKALPEVFS